jgi:ABC-type microcin C transport system duplicated ATPase subunit YejF
MYSTKSVASLVRNDLPLYSTIGAIHNVGSSDSFGGSAIVRLASSSGGRIRFHGFIYAGLTQPSQTNGAVSSTGR